MISRNCILMLLSVLIVLLAFTPVLANGNGSATPAPQNTIDITKKIPETLAESAKLFSMTVKEFSGTSYGRLTYWVLWWKLFGKDIWNIIVGIFVLAIGNVAVLRGYKYLLNPPITLTPDGIPDPKSRSEDVIFVVSTFLGVFLLLINISGLLAITI